MPRAPEIPARALASIARQIGSRLPALGALAPPGSADPTRLAREAPAEIGESFPVYMLGLDALQTGRRDLSQIARQTGVWQHQIRYGSQARDIARSMAPPPGAGGVGEGWQVQEVVHSPAAPRIEAAITWIDANVHDDSIANLLLVPAFHLTAFWLQESNRDNVVIADLPPGLADLRPLQLYSAEDFLNKLAAAKPISGVPPLT